MMTLPGSFFYKICNFLLQFFYTYDRISFIGIQVSVREEHCKKCVSNFDNNKGEKEVRCGNGRFSQVLCSPEKGCAGSTP